MTKKQLKAIVFMLSILVIAGVGVFLWKYHPVRVQATWMDENWKYRNSVPVTKTTADQTNVYIAVTINTSAAGQFKSNCGDLRWTDQVGNILPYYIVSGCTGASTVIHVFFNSLPQGTQTIYYYYGNSMASNGYSPLDFTTVATNYSVGSIGSQEFSPGPFAYWKFDEGYGTSANDTTTGSNTATFAGTTTPSWVTEDMCVSGKCLKFPGNTADLTVANTVSGIQTISFWARSASSSAALLALNANTRIFASNGTVKAEGFTSATVYVNGLPSTTFTANQWQFIEVTDTAGTSASAITIGRTFNLYLQGFMDEVKLYSGSTRTAAQVQADYNAIGTLNGTGATLGANKNNYYNSLSSGLVGYWKLDESSGNPVDSSGNATTISNTGSATFTGGKFSNAASLNGTSQYFFAADNATLSITSNLTMAAWIYPTSVSGTRDIIGKWDGAQKSYLFQQSATALVCYIGSSSNYVTTSGLTLAINTWYHVACVYDATRQTVTMYVNGVAQTTTTTGTIPSSIGDNTDRFHVGAQDSTTTAANFFSGTIDEARVYNRALSGNDISTLYTWAPGPMGWWKFDEHTGTTVNDSSGNGYNTTTTGSPTWASGKFGSGLLFNAAGQYVEYDNATAFDFGTSTLFTVEAWVKLTSNGSQQGIFTTVSNVAGSVQAYALTNNKLETYIGNQAGTTFCTLDSTDSVVDGKWHHVAIVYNRNASCTTNDILIYIDGIKEATTVTASSNNTNISIDNGGIRWSTEGSTTLPLNGTLDNAMMYNYTRSSSQITEDVNGGHPAPGSPVGSAQGWWKFDEGYGTTLHNVGSFGTSANATSSGAMWNPNGKFDKAVQYNGSTSYVATPKLGFMASSGATYNTLTWGGWVYPVGSVANKTIFIKNNEFRLTTDANSDANCAIFSGSWQTAAISSSALSLAAWSHVMCTYNGSTITVYINGVAQGTAAQTGNLTSSNTTGINLGWNAQGAQYYNGLIDEVKMYNVALTASEILLEYNHATAVILGSLSDTSGLSGGSTASNSASAQYCIPGDTATCLGPVGEWDFEERSGSTVNDTSGNNNAGAWNGTGYQHWVKGKVGGAGNFNGVDDYVAVPRSSAFEPATGLTIEAWVYWLSAGGSYEKIMNKSYTSNVAPYVSYELSQNASNQQIFAQINVAGTSYSTSGVAMSLNAWHHVAATWSTTQQSLILYIDGQQVTSNAGAAGSITYYATTLRFGWNDYTQASALWDGYIDQARIYSYARTPGQIQWDYNRGNPVGWWKFDECTGSTVHDGSGNGYNGTYGGSMSAGDCVTNASTGWYGGRSGKFNASLNFDGTSSNVTTSNVALIEPNSITYSTVSWGAWVYQASAQNTKTVVHKNSEFELYTSGANIPTCQVGGSGNTAVSTKAIPNNTWTHLMCTYDGANIKLYVNGALAGTNTRTGTLTSANTTNVNIGQHAAGSQFWGGQIDDVRIYNYALTQKQVGLVVNDNTAFYLGPSSGQP